MKKIIEFRKKIILPAVGAAYFLFAPFINVVQGEEPVLPKKEAPKIESKAGVKIDLDAKLENYSLINTDGLDTHAQRIEVPQNGNDRFFRADHLLAEDGYEKERVALRPKITLDNFFKGAFGGFASNDNQNNFSIGAELDGTLADLINVGLALEKVQKNGSDSRLFQLYAGVDSLKEVTLKVGYFMKDGVSHLQGVGWLALDEPGLFFGLGGDVNEKDRGKINACLANYGPKKGEGLGFRIKGQTDFRGNDNLEVTLNLGNNYSKVAHGCFMSLFDGINDPGIGDNIAKFRAPPLYLDCQKAIARIKANRAQNGAVNYTGELYVRTDDLLGPDLNLAAGGKWTRIDLPHQKAKDMFEIMLGAKIGPLTLEYSGGFAQDTKPTHSIRLETTAQEIYKFFGGK